MIPTAEEVLKLHYNMDRDEDGHPIYYDWSVKDAMIEFAKLHVEAALKEASNVLNVDNDGDYINHPTKELIISSYPLKNIK